MLLDCNIQSAKASCEMQPNIRDNQKRFLISKVYFKYRFRKTSVYLFVLSIYYYDFLLVTCLYVENVVYTIKDCVIINYWDCREYTSYLLN